MRKRQSNFTFVEVLVATAILGLMVAMVMGIMGAARARILRAQRRWAREHVLAQAVELHLLGGPQAMAPEGLLPEGFSMRYERFDAEDLPEIAVEVGGWANWYLAAMRISVYDAGGALINELTIDKIAHDEDGF